MIMYYEEKQNSNGRIYFRTAPDGDWREFSQTQYAERLQETQAKLAAAEKELEKLKQRGADEKN